MNPISLILIVWQYLVVLVGIAYFIDINSDGDFDLPISKRLRFNENSVIGKIGLKVADWLERI